ncbi:MAG: hypothetical protein WA434_06110 [Candidatus Acidiferrales bacterium]
MDIPQKGPAPNAAVERALDHLKQAEVDLLAAIRPGDHPQNATLLEVHSFLWEAISMLTKAAISGERRA